MKFTTKRCSTNPFKQIIFFILTIIILTVPGHSLSSSNAYLLSVKKGILFSDNGGRSWGEVNAGLPEGTIPLRLYISGTTKFLITFKQGIFRLKNNSKTWHSINSNDFRKRSQFFPNAGFRKISAFAIDPLKPERLALATKHTLYMSENNGDTWKRINTQGLHRRNYITALALRDGKIYAGTSFNGFYRLHRGRYRRLNRGLPQEPYSGSLHFTEELTALSHGSNGILYGGFRFGGELRRLLPHSLRWDRISLPREVSSYDSMHQIVEYKNNIYASIGSHIFVRGSKEDHWKEIIPTSFIKNLPRNIGSLSLTVIGDNKSLPTLSFHLGRPRINSIRREGANRRSIYASIPAVRKRLGKLIKTMKSSNLNAIVIDMKDDFGNIYYPTGIKTAREIRSARRPARVKKILKRLKDNNIYTVARIVIFKDKKLFRAYQGRYTIKNLKTGKPWRGNPHEYWVDPHSKFVQDYNIQIAQELEKLGFDEIQFDYIRFPSDGPTYLCSFNFKKDPEMYKSEILADFLQRARNSLTVPISTDIYGFNSWYSFGNWIGQDMEEFSRIVDVISPMVYPSHFGNRFYMKGERALRPYRIVHDGGKRAVAIADSGIVIRPYLQAFKMMSPTWGPGYILNQVRGARESGCSGFTFWNARGEYKTVSKAFSKNLTIQ